MKKEQIIVRGSLFFTAVAAGFCVLAAQTDLSSIPLSTYYAPSSVDVKPNILFVLDDSGSMDWDAMPDQAAWYLSSNAEYRPRNYSATSGMPPYMRYNSAFNGLAYNPAIRYLPPVTFDSSGNQDTTTYPSMTGVSVATGGDSSASAASPNWKAVKNDGYGVQSTSTTNLVDNAYTYVVVPGEYCAKPDLRSCTTASSPSANYQYPAKFRWCTSEALSSCRATWDSGNAYPRMPAPRIATITVSGSNSTKVSGITVGGQQILSATTAGSSTASTVADQLRDAINSCTKKLSGNCTTVGYLATSSGSVVTIYAPGIISDTPVLTTSSGTMTFSLTSFARAQTPLPYWLDTTYTTQSSGTVPGENLRYTITSSINSYAYPGLSVKDPARTDCAGTTCTYAEEMTNYANWWTYYRTRMQMMKTSSAIAFSKIDTAADVAAGKSRFRVGYMTLNNNTNSDFVNLGEFDAAQRFSWYAKLLAANPNNGTPLRVALSKAGRLYSGRLNGESLNGVTVLDPMQYSCQQNFTILSTDGFWNGNAGVKLDGSTGVGNQDATMAPPYNDGGSATTQESTSTLQTRTVTQSAERGTLQLQIAQLQKRTAQLQARTSSPQESTSLLQASTSKLQKGASYKLQMRTSSNSGASWSAWSDVSSTGVCEWDTSGSSRRQCQYVPIALTWADVTSCRPHSLDTATSHGSDWYPQVQCQYTAWTAPANVSSCAPAAQSSGTGTWSVATARQCSYTAWTAPSTATSCTPASQSSGSGTWTVATARQCSYAAWSAWGDVGSCTSAAQATSGTYNLARQCQYAAWTAATDVPTCTPAPKSTGSPYSVGQAVECPQRVVTPYADAAACSVATDAAGVMTQCQYRWDSLGPVQSCSPTYAAGDYSNPIVFKNCTTNSSPWAAVASCNASTGWSVAGTKTECQYTAWTGWVTTSSCVGLEQSVAPNYTVGTARKCQVTSVTGGYSNTLADVAAYYYNTDLRNSAQAGVDATGTCVGPVIAPATTANDLCANNVPPSGRDVASWQHMTTFTLGLGAQGKMLFTPTYWSDNSGDFYSVMNKQTADPANGVCLWLSSGNTCVWPQPASDSPANIDDLWHAAVNGRGNYFSATDPGSLATGLTSTLKAIVDTPRPGTSAAAASSNPNISSGDNFVFSSYYKSVDWYGEIYRQRFDTETKTLKSGLDWSGMSLLDCAVTQWKGLAPYIKGDAYRRGSVCYLVTNDYVSEASWGAVDTANTAVISSVPGGCSAAWAAARDYVVGDIYSNGGTCYFVIKNYKSGETFGGADTQNTNVSVVAGSPTSRTVYTKVGNSLQSFEWANLTLTQQAYFTAPHISFVAASGSSPASGLSQFCMPAGGACLSSTAQTKTTIADGGAAGEALVNYLRGDRTNEGGFFRARKHVLGDIVSSEARYVKTPMFNYSDSGYAAYKALRSSRAGMVYVAANDGMLHAFDAETGHERWAYIPELVLPNLYRLADNNYTQNHQYFVDGTPEFGDVCPTAPTTACSDTQWRTILVGGLNRGGKGFYALDVTDPGAPALLWEFTDAHMGYSYGNPRITKLSTGQWVVILTSGYNNDGLGYLYVLDAYTGAVVKTMTTAAGDAATPSGLAKIAAHSVTADTNNTTSAVYGGDMLGNLWRFSINDASSTAAQLLVTFKDASNNVQPITARPSVTTVKTASASYPVVIVGTGAYLGVSDVSSSKFQSMYAVKDVSGAEAFANPRSSGSNFIQQTLTATTCSASDANANACTQGETIRKITAPNAVDWATKNGWYIDFLTPGERASTDPSLALGTLAFTTITPNNATATPCGQQSADTTASFYYTLDHWTGGALPGMSGVVATSLGNVIATRPVLIRLPDGSVLALIRVSGGASGGGASGSGASGYYPGGKDDSATTVKKTPTAPTGGASRRVSWRELTMD